VKTFVEWLAAALALALLALLVWLLAWSLWPTSRRQTTAAIFYPSGLTCRVKRLGAARRSPLSQRSTALDNSQHWFRSLTSRAHTSSASGYKRDGIQGRSLRTLDKQLCVRDCFASLEF
jgi:hypothetical protein